MRGKVVSLVGGVYDVYTDNKQLVKVKPLGILKHKKIKILVGDEVEVSFEGMKLLDV